MNLTLDDYEKIAKTAWEKMINVYFKEGLPWNIADERQKEHWRNGVIYITEAMKELGYC